MNVKKMKELIDADLPRARQLLESVVSVNSHSPNREGTNEVGGIFREWFEGLGLSTRVIPCSNAGDILVLSNNAWKQKGSGGFLFLSHMDTVFPPDGQIVPYSFDGKLYRGNGTCDDKGGAVITWQALSVLKAQGLLESAPIRVMLTTDEEVGSPESKTPITEEAKSADLVLVVEYGKPRQDGATIVTNRLGRGSYQVNLEGERAEEAMLDIIENSYFLATPESQRVIRVKDFERLPHRCRSRFYFGYLTEAEGDFMMRVLKKLIFNAANRYGVTCKAEGGKVRPPLLFGDSHWRMVETLTEAARDAGFKLYHENRKSCSDGSFVPADVPVLDGMGPVGDNVHTSDEYMTAESLTMRPLLIAMLMSRLMAKSKENLSLGMPARL